MNNQAFFVGSLDDHIPTIDLHHTDNIPDALILLEQGLFSFFQQGHKSCRVIHGIGDGKMAQAVDDALALNPMVGEAKMEENGGSTLVLF